MGPKQIEKPSSVKRPERDADLRLISRVRGGDRQSWEDLLNHMLNEGAPLSDEDYTVLLRYLARNFSSQ